MWARLHLCGLSELFQRRSSHNHRNHRIQNKTDMRAVQKPKSCGSGMLLMALFSQTRVHWEHRQEQMRNWLISLCLDRVRSKNTAFGHTVSTEWHILTPTLRWVMSVGCAWLKNICDERDKFYDNCVVPVAVRGGRLLLYVRDNWVKPQAG